MQTLPEEKALLESCGDEYVLDSKDGSSACDLGIERKKCQLDFQRSKISIQNARDYSDTKWSTKWTTGMIPARTWALEHFCILSGHLDLTRVLQLSRRCSITFQKVWYQLCGKLSATPCEDKSLKTQLKKSNLLASVWALSIWRAQ